MADNGRHDAKTRILDAAFAIIEEVGEAGLRFVDVAERAQVVLSLITRHYGTREDLIAAVHARRFAGLVAQDVAVLAGLVGAQDAGQVATIASALTRDVVAADRADSRLARVASVGAISGRPELTETIRKEATFLVDRLTETVQALQADGMITEALDARALAVFIQAYSFGMVLADLDVTPPAREAIAQVIERVIGVFLTTDV